MSKYPRNISNQPIDPKGKSFSTRTALVFTLFRSAKTLFWEDPQTTKSFALFDKKKLVIIKKLQNAGCCFRERKFEMCILLQRFLDIRKGKTSQEMVKETIRLIARKGKRCGSYTYRYESLPNVVTFMDTCVLGSSTGIIRYGGQRQPTIMQVTVEKVFRQFTRKIGASEKF